MDIAFLLCNGCIKVFLRLAISENTFSLFREILYRLPLLLLQRFHFKYLGSMKYYFHLLYFFLYLIYVEIITIGYISVVI